MYKPSDPLPLAFISRKIKKEPLALSTQSHYIYTISQIHRFYTNEKINDDDDICKCIRGEPFNHSLIKKQFPYLFNDDYVYDVISRFTKQIINLAGIFSRIPGFLFLRRRIVPYIDIVNEHKSKKRENLTIDKDVKDTLSFNRDDILSNLDKLNNNRDKMIYLLNTLIPPRRGHDFRYTKITNAIPDDDIDKSFNYYYDKIIYIYNTKNKKYYECNIPDEIIPFIDTSKEFLLGDKLMGQAQISALIINVFKKVYGYDKYNITLIRRLYATHSFDNMNKKEVKQSATAMGHSFEEHFNYTYDKNNIISN
jgi:hypothetical protein